MKTKEKGSTLLGFAVGLALAALMIAGCKTNVSSTPETFAVTFSVDGGNGKLKAKADGITETTESPITVEQGKTVTFTATADSGYRVKGWTCDGEAVNGTNASYSFTVTKGVEVKVSFDSTPPTPPASADKTYTVGGISFMMKGIAAVTNGKVGHSDYSSNNAEHTVSLTAYRIGETEVTQELWKKVMGNNPSSFSSSPESGEVQEKRPVERVSWYDCIAFCNELTKQAGLGESQCVYSVEGHIYGTADAVAKKVPEMDMNKKGFRLPTEAEWEWAAMGGTEHKWAGTNVKGQLINYAWYRDSDGGKCTHEVKKKQANGYGLYDMSGNVWEWCWDWSGVLPNPMPPDYAGPADSGSDRIVRGGGWYNDADGAARAIRFGLDPGRSGDDLGVRLVLRP